MADFSRCNNRWLIKLFRRRIVHATRADWVLFIVLDKLEVVLSIVIVYLFGVIL